MREAEATCMDRQSHLTQRPGESLAAHRAFLLWMMQAPSKRSSRATARAMDYSDARVRQWRQLYGWEERSQAMGAGSDTLAARAYAMQYHRLSASKEVALVAKYMVVQYLPPGSPAPGLAAGPPQAAPPPLSEKAKAVELHDHAAEEEVRGRRTRQTHLILDAVTARLADALGRDKDGKLKPFKVGVPDLLVVQKLRRDLDANTVAGGTGNPLATSVRVEQAAQSGGDVLGALAEDHAELGLILGTLQTATEASNVLPFPGGRQVAREEPG